MIIVAVLLLGTAFALFASAGELPKYAHKHEYKILNDDLLIGLMFHIQVFAAESERELIC